MDHGPVDPWVMRRMLPRGLPDASQMSPRCVPGDSQKPPRCLPEISRRTLFGVPRRCHLTETVDRRLGGESDQEISMALACVAGALQLE